MKTRYSVATVIATLVVFSIALTLPAGAGEKPVLNRDMPGDTIIALIGKPDEITKIKSDKFQAETWTYRRKIEQTVYQTANLQAYIPAVVGFDSGGIVMGTAMVPDYRLKYAAAYQVTALLMVNGKLYMGRQWFAKSEDYCN